MSVNEMVIEIVKLSTDEQYDLAFKVAENIGMELCSVQPLAELAERFESAGEAVWTGSQVADAIRRYAADGESILTNRPKDETK